MDKQVVVLGAGFGGLRAALLLAKNGVSVILIDKNDYHTYTPLLYELAVTHNEVANICGLKNILTFPIKEIFEGLPVTFIQEEVKNVDLISGDIHLASQIIHFDCLILALGAEPNYFHIPGLQENSLPFKTFLDALRVRGELTSQPFGKIPKVVIGGGGSTGVELAGEIQFAGLGQVTIIQALPGILSGFDPKVIALAEKRLKELNVAVKLSAIKEVRKNILLLTSGEEISFDLLIWAGGNKSARLIDILPLKKEFRGHLSVADEMTCLPQTPDLQLTSKIYAIGDTVCFYNQKTGQVAPGLASIAIEQAEVVVKNILGDAQVYQFKKSFPYILPIGGKYAVFQYGWLVVDGLPAWCLKGLVELFYLLKIMPWLKAFKIWLRGLKIFLQNDRLG